MLTGPARLWRDTRGECRFVLVVAALAPIAWAPIFLQVATPRVALALALVPLGLAVLIRDALGIDRAALLAVMLIGAGLVSALLSPAPRHSLTGRLDWWTGWFGLVAALAWWSMGRTLDAPSRRLLLYVLTGGALWNGLFALLQVVFDRSSGDLAGFPGRGAGTMVNPVFYGAFMSGVLAIWVFRLKGTWASYALIVALAFGAGLSGGRIVLLTLGVVALGALLVPARRTIALKSFAATVAGIALSMIVLAIAHGADRTVSDRVVSARGIGVRLGVWRKTIEATFQRPLFGWGPGNVELAVERQFDLAYTQRYLGEPGTLERWLDAHNVVLNMLVTLGVVGTALALTFVVMSLRPVREIWSDDVDRALLAGSAAIAANWLLQPWTVHTIPVALLMFGAACHRTRQRHGVAAASGITADGPRQADPIGSVVLAGTGVVIAVLLLANMFVLDRSIERGEFDRVDTLARVGYRDAWLDDQLVTTFIVASADADEDVAIGRALVFAQRAAESYPVMSAQSRVGEVLFVLGEYEEAKEAEGRAADLQPWHPLPHRRLLFLARATGDDRLERSSRETLCLISTELCREASEGAQEESGTTTD